MDVLGHEKFDRVGQKQVDIFDEVEEIVPGAMLLGRRLVCEVALD